MRDLAVASPRLAICTMHSSLSAAVHTGPGRGQVKLRTVELQPLCISDLGLVGERMFLVPRECECIGRQARREKQSPC